MKIKKNKYNSWLYDAKNSRTRRLIKRLKNNADRTNNKAIIERDKKELD